MQSLINNIILTGSHQNTVFMSNLCKLMGQWIKISAQKYDSGINMSAVPVALPEEQKECKKKHASNGEKTNWVQKVAKYRSTTQTLLNIWGIEIFANCGSGHTMQWQPFFVNDVKKWTCSHTLNPTPSVVLTLPFLWRMFFTAWLYPGMGPKISCQMAPLVCFSPILPGLQHLSPSTPLTHKTSQNWVYWLSQTLLLCLVKNLLPFVVYFWQSHISDGYRHTL